MSTRSFKTIIMPVVLFSLPALLLTGYAQYPKDGCLPEVAPVRLHQTEVWAWEDYHDKLGQISFEETMQWWKTLGLTGFMNSGLQLWKMASAKDPAAFTQTWSDITNRSGITGYLPVIHPDGPDLVCASLDGRTNTPVRFRIHSVASDAYVSNTVELIRKMVNSPFRDCFMQREGRYIVLAVDEIQLRFRAGEKGSMADYSDAAIAQFRAYLQSRFGTVAEFNRQASEQERIERFEAVAPPYYTQRFDRPWLWKVWMDYRAWSIGEFYVRIQKMLDQERIPAWIMTDGLGSMVHDGAMLGQRYFEFVRGSSIIETEVFHPEHPYSYVTYATIDRLKTWIDRPYIPMFHAVTAMGWPAAGQQSATYWIDLVNRMLGNVIAHDVQGLCHWIYPFGLQSYFFRNIDWGKTREYNHRQEDMLQEMAWWHFMVRENAGFFLKAKPYRPRIAVMPGWSSQIFYPIGYSSHKFDCLWGCKALREEHYPFHLLDEYEVAAGALKDYDALYVFSSERIPEEVARAIIAFHARGGYVFADCDSLQFDIAGKPRVDLARVLGIKPARFLPVFAGPARYEQYDLTVIAQELRGLVRFVGSDLAPTNTLLEVYGDIQTAKPEGAAKVMATLNDEPVAIQGERSFWTGVRAGRQIFNVCPEECVWSEHDVGSRRFPRPQAFNNALNSGAYGYETQRRLITQLARMANIPKPVEVFRENADGLKKVAVDVSVQARIDPETRVWMVALVDHENQGMIYDSKARAFVPTPVTLVLDDACRGMDVYDLTGAEPLAVGTNGQWRVTIQPLRSRVLMVGPAAALKPWQEWAQRHKTKLRENRQSETGSKKE